MHSSHSSSTRRSAVPRHGLARVLSKLGVCSRSQAEVAIRAGRVSVDGRVIRDPELSADAGRQRILLDGEPVVAAKRIYIAMNKPRGVVVSAADERDRRTVYDLLAEAKLPWLGPVGRLDKASEGLLLLSNDSLWSARLTEPQHHVDKTYHVQIDRRPDDALLRALLVGVEDRGEHLAAGAVTLLREGEKNAWLEITLDEGRNRHIRRLLDVHGVKVLRLIRVKIGPLPLGELAKGQWRHLTSDEVAALGVAGDGCCLPAASRRTSSVRSTPG